MYGKSLAVAILVLSITSGAALAEEVFEDWNNGDVAGWLPCTILDTLEWIGDGGVDDSGYVRATEDPSGYDVAGAQQFTGSYIGDFGARGYLRVECALQLIAGTFDSVVFRLRYLDGGGGAWSIPLTDDFSLGGWRTVGVAFDTDWSDGEAMAAGWVQEPDTGTFAETMANVHSSEVRCQGSGDLVVGVDNFLLSDENVAAENSTWSAVKGAYR